MAKRAVRRRYDPVVAVGQAMETLDNALDELDERGVVFIGMNIKAPTEERTDWLLTMKAEVEGERKIAFVSAFHLTEVVDRAIRFFADNKLDWKEDNYAT